MLDPADSGLVVATATDSEFLELTGVMLASLAAKGGLSVRRAYVFCDGLTSADQALLAACYPPDKLRFVDLTNELFGWASGLEVNKLLSRTTYARLIIPRLVEPEAARLLYLDCDIVVNGDLGPLETLELGDTMLGAVANTVHAPDGTMTVLDSFNAGVLLVDLVAWRKADMSARLIAAVTSGAYRNDQVLLNHLFAGAWTPLGRQWNFAEISNPKRYFTPTSDFEKARIVHYVGRIKPNHTDSRHPADTLFHAIRATTPFARRPLIPGWQRRLRLAQSRLRRHLLRLLKRFPRRDRHDRGAGIA